MLANRKFLAFKVDVIWLVVFTSCLASVYFFAPTAFINKKILLVLEFGCALLLFCFSGIFKSSSSKTLFGNPIRAFLFVIMFSIVSSSLIYGQSLLPSLRATVPLLIYSLYFFLQNHRFEVRKLEEIVLIICVLYLLCFLFALYKAPEQIFGINDKAIFDQRGVYRVRVYGRGFLHLAFFIALNRYIVTNKFKWLYFAFILFAFIVAHVIRQYILFSLVIGGLMLLVNVSWKRKVFITITSTLVIIMSFNLPVFEALYDLSQRQLNEQSYGEDIRVTAYKFFFNDFSKHIYTDIFGNGMPFGSGSYGQYVKGYVNNYLHIFHSDVGYAFSYANFGILSILVLGIILIRVVNNNLSKQALYAKYFIIFSFCSNILSSYIFSPTSYTAVCIALYIFDVTKTKESQYGRKT